MQEKRIFERKIYKDLLKWKEDNSKHRKNALIIKGPRQIGKTTIVKQFAEQEYENVVYINFATTKFYNECFDGNLDGETIVKNLLFKNDSFQFVPNKTLIIFDEIQECARARSCLKCICEEGKYDVICTGSLLGVMGYNLRRDASIPVGFERHLTMSSMDFKEFMLAIGYRQKDHFDYIERKLETLTPIEDAIHTTMCEHYKWFLLVGGMPEVVQTYIDTKDINKVRETQQKIIDTYRSDFGKYLDYDEKEKRNAWDVAKLNKLYDSIPSQLARNINVDKDNFSLRFKFNEVSSGGKFRDFYLAIQWLKDAGLVNVCSNTKELLFPINAYEVDNSIKIYMNDTGLFMSTLPLSYADHIHNSEFNVYKGFIYENLMADQLSKNGFRLQFYEWDKKGEIDFLINTIEGLVAIDVKANKGSTTSLRKFLKADKNLKGIKLSNNNIGLVDNLLTMPSYLSYLITPEFRFPKK